MDEESGSAPGEVTTEIEKKPKRTRRTKAEVEADLPPFHASLTDVRLHATYKRVVRTGPYESADVMLHVDAERDPRFGLSDNLEMLGAMVRQEGDVIAAKIQAEITVEK